MSDTMSVTMSQYHLRRKPFNSQRIAEMDLKKSYDFYRDRFSDASDFTFVFVKQLVLTYLGSLPTTGRSENWRDVGVHYPTGVIEKTVRAGIEPKSMVQINFPGNFVWNDKNRASMAAMKGVLQIMLREVLREDMGGTYGAWVRAWPQRYPHEQYQMSIGFGCAPERAEELIRAAFATIDSLKRYGPSVVNLNKVKEQARRERETNLKENDFWADEFEDALRNGGEFTDILKEGTEADEVTAQDVQDAAQRYLDMNNYVKVVLYPKTTVTDSGTVQGTAPQP
jgi:zinc protease